MHNNEIKTIAIEYDLVDKVTGAYVDSTELIVSVRKSITVHSGMVNRLVSAVEFEFTVDNIEWRII